MIPLFVKRNEKGEKNNKHYTDNKRTVKPCVFCEGDFLNSTSTEESVICWNGRQSSSSSSSVRDFLQIRQIYGNYAKDTFWLEKGIFTSYKFL